MYIKLLLNLILGYVRIEIEGYYVERFINICTNRKILIWNLKREKGVKLYLNIGINDFRKLTKIAKQTNCKIRILRKRGIPFLLNRYKKRKIFACFLILIFILILISSKYIWNIEIKVEDNQEIENIAQDLENLGLKKGILKSKVDTDKIINEIRLKRHDIAWIGIDLEGTNIIVDIVKADSSPDIIKNTDYCNIIAKKPGVISKITAQNGTAMVKTGDTVNKGDILIAGYMDGKYTERRYVHSLGEVKAKVWYQETKEVKYNEEILTPTGNIENKYQISLNNWNIKLYNKTSKYDIYETYESKTNLKLFKSFYLPITITKITNSEQKKETKTYTMEDAKNKALDELSKKIEEQIENKQGIINKNVKTEEKEDGVNVTLTYEVLENIEENSILIVQDF